MGDIVALRFKKTERREAKMNIMVGEIVRLDLDSEEKPVLVHKYGPYPRINLATAAHKAAWSPRIRIPEGDVLAKTLGGTRRSWRGKRVVESYKFSDILQIPPLTLQNGKISAEGQANIRQALKTASGPVENARASTAAVTSVQWEQMGSWLAAEIRHGVNEQVEVYDNMTYVRKVYCLDEHGYITPLPRENRKKQ